MPIIGRVGRKSFKVRTLNGSIHLILLLGAITMIYPFMIMVSASFKSNVDSKNFSIIPKYFYDEEMLFKKHVESRMNEETNLMNEVYGHRFLSFEFVQDVDNPVESKRVDWLEFLELEGEKHDQFDYYLSETFGRGIEPLNNRKFRQMVKKENNNSLEEYNRTYNSSVQSWDEIIIETKEILSRGFSGDFKGITARFNQFSKDAPIEQKIYADIDGFFVTSELLPAFRNDINLTNENLGLGLSNWAEFVTPMYRPEGELQPYWDHFVKRALNVHHLRVKPSAMKQYQNFLQDKYDDIALLNRTYFTSYASFSDIELPEKLPTSGALMVDWTFFIESIVSPADIYITGVEYRYRDWLQKKYGNIDELNQAYRNGYESFDKVALSTEFPKGNTFRARDWEHFVKNVADEKNIRINPRAQISFLEYLKKRFPSQDNAIDLATMNKIYGTNYKSEHDIYPSNTVPENASYKSEWLLFLKNGVPNIFIEVDAELEEKNWQAYLRNQYQNIDVLNTTYKLTYSDFNEVNLDKLTIDYLNFKDNKSSIFKEHLTRNYAMVLNEMLYNGRAMFNTFVYVTLAIVTALIVNPLAAYALSRFKLPSSYKIILILMLTMAFPPMVMGIPNFLILKRLNMLNTFWALILPGLADGYFIFLLKGFFDSLPQELFESATVDGAGENRLFWQIAMQLSKPIMAVIALNAFNAAYRNFMFAFIVCQDKSMWTMMVSIYQLMQRAASGVGFAALVIAAIPTFLVFIFFQNIIIKGIVVPTEK